MNDRSSNFQVFRLIKDLFGRWRCRKEILMRIKCLNCDYVTIEVLVMSPDQKVCLLVVF